MELVAEKYKETEVGLIPSDWEVKTIGEIFTFYSTSNFSKAEMLLNGEVGCVHYGLIHAIDNSHYSLSNGTKYYVTKEQAKYENLQEGDVIMVDASEDLVGLNKSVEVFDLNNKEYIAGLHTFHLRDFNSYYVGTFRGLILNYYSVKRQMLRLAVGMKVFGVSKPQLQQVFVPVPPKAEQTAIATALSDADALITSLENLISKKRNIKQGAMQKLLQPKDGWEVKKLGDLITYKNGKSFESLIDENGEYYLITLNSIDIKGELKKEHLRVKVFDNSLEKDDLVMVLSDVAHGNFLGLTDVIPENNKYVLNQRMGALKNLKGVTPRFLSTYINHFQSYFKVSGKGSSQQNLGKDDILKFEIHLPTAYEQNQISTILSDMDAEIEALEIKLEKYRNLKTGMMQNLLTGKIRI